jgi:hypothetical protein
MKNKKSKNKEKPKNEKPKTGGKDSGLPAKTLPASQSGRCHIWREASRLSMWNDLIAGVCTHEQAESLANRCSGIAGRSLLICAWHVGRHTDVTSVRFIWSVLPR